MKFIQLDQNILMESALSQHKSRNLLKLSPIKLLFSVSKLIPSIIGSIYVIFVIYLNIS